MPNSSFRRSNFARRLVAFFSSLVLGLAIFMGPDWAQGLNQQLQQLQQFQQPTILGQPGQASQPSAPESVTIEPASPESRTPLPPSRLEQIMSARTGATLRQFGYDQLGRGRVVTAPTSVAVQDDYILGVGDEIVVTLRGQENSELRSTVNNNGQIILPRLNPLSAAGRAFGNFRDDLAAAVRRSYVATNAFVSVARIREITVQVLGEVNVPGQRVIPGLASAVDALALSGGIKKTGSLRNVIIQRGSSRLTVDLYSVLTTSGAASNLRLANGDRILVPSLGKTVAISGLVRQPGIFELPAGASSVTARNLIALAGGQEVRGTYRLAALRILPTGNTQMTQLANDSAAIEDSEVLFVQLGADQTINQATLSGETPLAGQYPIVSGTKLSEVLKAPGALPPVPYTLFGIIARKDSRTLLRKLVAFTPVSVLNSGEDEQLQGDDVIRVLSVNEVRLLTNTVRLYSERQAAAQAAIRNPLSAPVSTISSGGQAAPAATTVPAGVASLTGITAAARPVQQQPQQQQPASVLSPTGDLAEMQRRDIAELADTVDPVTQQANSSTGQAPPRAVQSEIPNSVAAGLSGLVGQGGSAIPASVPAAGEQSTSDANPARAALNFESVDTASGRIALNRSINTFGDLARQLGVDQLVLVNFLIDHQVVLNGAVSGPGYYFVGPNVALQDLVSAAGGTTNWADESGVELITTAVDGTAGRSATRRVALPLRQGMLANYVVHPRDQFRFNQVFNDAGVGTATVQGEVRFTGTYQITRGEHLSELLARAGGLTGTAYPYGTVFLRKSAAATEREGYIRAATEIEEELVVAMTRIGNDKIDPSTFGALQGFVAELRNQRAIGRIAIAADPSVLASKPELDPLLEPGDTIYIPQRPSTISVLGQVMQPGSLPYRSNFTLKEYVQMAGGYSPTSAPSNAFIVLPDGSARKIETSWLGFESNTALPPGSAIVVPRDVTPINTRQLILDITSIMSQLAVSMASLAVISRN